jgi:hypothetical protein
VRASPSSKMSRPSTLSATTALMPLSACLEFIPNSFLVLGEFQPHPLSWSSVPPSLLPGVYQCHSES